MLMCLAEALLRIPDADTADKLIADKIAIGQWSDYLGEADSLFVNASTWGLMLTGKLVRESELEARDPVSFLRRLVARLGEPVVRTAFRHAMRIMGRQFVMGRDIGEALARAASEEGARYRHTYDMLGESALTEPDAQRYLASYRAAIEAVGRSVRAGSEAASWPSVSVKLSALHPRYEYARRQQVLAELGLRLESLALAARSAGIALTVDAEEAERLEISLLLIDALLDSPALAGWDGLGLAVQAYSKRAPEVIRYLQRRADATQRVLNLRLVKGAYWDSEVKRAQERGLAGLSGVHAKGEHRRRVPRLRAAPARGQRACLSAVRDAQRAHDGFHHSPREGARPRFRIPAPARHGRGALLRTDRPGGPRPRLVASTPRSARTRNCCHTSCGACWRMAPTPPS